MSKLNLDKWCENLANDASITIGQAKYIHKIWKKACECREVFTAKDSDSHYHKEINKTILDVYRQKDIDACETLNEYTNLLGFTVDYGTGVYPILRKDNRDYYYAE